MNVSRDGASTTSLRNLCQCFTTFIINSVFLASTLSLRSFSFTVSFSSFSYVSFSSFIYDVVLFRSLSSEQVTAVICLGYTSLGAQGSHAQVGRPEAE